MNRTQRRIVAEKLMTHGVISHALSHEVYRCTTIHGSGLTEKENLFLRKAHADMQDAMSRISKIRDRCHKSSEMI